MVEANFFLCKPQTVYTINSKVVVSVNLSSVKSADPGKSFEWESNHIFISFGNQLSLWDKSVYREKLLHELNAPSSLWSLCITAMGFRAPALIPTGKPTKQRIFMSFPCDMLRNSTTHAHCGRRTSTSGNGVPLPRCLLSFPPLTLCPFSLWGNWVF